MNTDHTTDQHYLMALDTIRNGGGTYNRAVFREAVLPHRYIVAVGAPYERVIPATARNRDQQAIWDSRDNVEISV